MPLEKRILSVEGALEALLPEFKRIAGPVAARLRDPTISADDLVSIANVAVIEAYPQARHGPSDNPQGYLFTIGQNAMRDAVRASETLRRSKLPPPEETVVESAEDTAVRKLYTEELLASLSPVLRETVERRFLRQQTFKKIAAEMNVPTSTVQSRLLVAMRKLRAKFADEE